MPDDRLRELFSRAAGLSVDVPPVEAILARGRQRRRRATLQASTIAWTILLAAGFGAPQVSGSLAAGPGPHGRIVRSIGAPGASYPSAPGGSRHTSSAQASQSTARSDSPAPSPSSGATGTYAKAVSLPPPGRGQLLLALDSAHHYVMTRTDSARSPVRVTGLEAAAGSSAVLATNPAGGWVVTLASSSRSRARAVAGIRLALVVASGHSVRFGPLFKAMTVTSAAVSQDGSRVAVAVTVRTGGARIEVLALPGHQVSRQSWHVPSSEAGIVTDLSWSPSGRHLSYLAGQSASGSPRGPLTLDTAVGAVQAPQLLPLPLAMKTGLTCVPRAAAWLGTSGRFAVLSECASTGVVVLQTSNARTGAAVGQPLVVAHQLGCGSAGLSSNTAGSAVLISYCGVYLDSGGKVRRESASLTAAALSD